VVARQAVYGGRNEVKEAEGTCSGVEVVVARQQENRGAGR